MLQNPYSLDLQYVKIHFHKTEQYTKVLLDADPINPKSIAASAHKAAVYIFMIINQKKKRYTQWDTKLLSYTTLDLTDYMP